LFVWSVWGMNPNLCDTMEASTLSDVIDIAAPENNITIEWTNDSVVVGQMLTTGGKWEYFTVEEPAIKSIYVPHSSPIFERLVGQQG